MALLDPGDRIGDWVVVDTLGEGGMGAVYRCHNTLSKKIQAAVKVLKQHGLGKARERFLREVELLASVQHPAVVRVLGGGDDAERGLLYMAMELLHGEELTDRLKRGPLEWDEACRLFRMLGEGLLAAHAAGVVHRDIKPQNILLCDDGTAKLLDFGIAVQTGGEKLTREGQVPGTVSYMAPEVFEGGRPDHRADIYALGLVLWEALTGKEAFPEDPTTGQRENLVRIMSDKLRSEALDPGARFPRPVRDLVARCTAPEPDDRLNELTLFVRVLEQAPTGRVDVQISRPRRRRGRGLWIGLGVLAALVLVVGGGSVVLVGGLGAVLWARSGGTGGPTGGGGPIEFTESSWDYGSPDVELPEGFPFELTDNANIVSATKTDAGGTPVFTVSYLTEEDPVSVKSYYEEVFAGRGLQTTASEMSTADGKTWSVSGWSTSENASFSIGPNYGLGEGHLVSLTWMPM